MRSRIAAMALAAISSAALPALSVNTAAATAPSSPRAVPSLAATPSQVTLGDSGIGAPRDDVVEALVVQSWSACDSEDVLWHAINDTWTELGSTPVNIVFDSRPACKGRVSYDDLVASGADVLILSDVANWGVDLGKREEKAIKRYVEDGHGLLSTYLTFRSRDVRHRLLEPLLGVDSSWRRRSQPLEAAYDQLERRSPLFKGVPNPYVSSGCQCAEVPRDRNWDDADLTDTARYVARTADGMGTIVVNVAPDYRSVYVASMPEYRGSDIDAQFLYNALTYVAPTTGPYLR